MKFNKVLKIYADFDKSQACMLPFYGKGSLSSAIRDIQFDVRSLKNKSMRLSFDYDQVQYEYFKFVERCKEEITRDSWPTAEPKDFSNYKTFDGFLYNVLAGNYSDLNKNIVASVTRATWGEYKKDKKQIVTGEKSLRTYGTNQPIPVTRSNTKLYLEDDFNYVIQVSLFSGDFAKSIGMKPGGVRFILHDQTESERTILDRLLSGEYRLCETKLCYDERKNHRTKAPRGWHFCIGYGFEKNTDAPELDKNKIMGVDLGITNVLYLGWSGDDHFKKYIPGSEIRRFQAVSERRKRDILQCGPVRGKGSIGHGTKCAIHRGSDFEHHIHNFKENKNWRYAHFVIDNALKNGFGTIQMENLSGVQKSEKFDRAWTFYSLQQKIENLAAENGITVKKIDPKYTSQMCSRCGYISSENRKTQSEFRCVACGYRKNADHNAAINISKPDIEKLIKEQLSTLKTKECEPEANMKH